MAYTTIDDPSDYFNTLIWTGNGASSRAISGLGFQPDWSWFKERSGAEDHMLFDSVRGATKRLNSNTTAAETDSGADRRLLSFDSDGFTVGLDLGINGNTETYVGWNWKAGTSFSNDASATSIGSIDSAGSVSTDAGFSIITYTGNGTSGASVKHGLSTKPAMMIIKNRDEADSWQVYHHKNTSAPATETLQLNETGATSDTSNRWNDTEPTTAILTLGNNTTVNKNTIKYIGYIFSEKQGYSKFGSYTGNGNADGTFVYTGFKPAMVICKKSSASGTNWGIIDNKRANSFNQISAMLNPNSSGTEGANNNCDFVSNGFKWRTSDGNSNASATYIYMAFAENPFVTSTGVPATAR